MWKTLCTTDNITIYSSIHTVNLEVFILRFSVYMIRLIDNLVAKQPLEPIMYEYTTTVWLQVMDFVLVVGKVCFLSTNSRCFDHEISAVYIVSLYAVAGALLYFHISI